MKQIDFETMIRIADYINRGFPQKKIAEMVGVSPTTVCVYSKKLQKEPITNNEINKYYWLKRNWNFTGRTCGNDAYIGTHKNGYRVVRKGDRGHLRTPYRPDYRFR